MANENYRIILVEDDPSLGYLLSEYLQMKGFHITWAKNGKIALTEMDANSYDLGILDIMMPEMDGFTLAKEMQLRNSTLPFIFLSAKSLKIDVLKGFSLGAVDYLKKPIDEEELVIRIQMLLSRLSTTSQDTDPKNEYKLGAYRFNSLNQELVYNEQTIHLTTKENEVLEFLVTHKNRLCRHKDILIGIWRKNDYFNKKSLNVFITHLRKYLEKDPSLKIENVHGQGFILRDDQ
jgi:DNA-binding response OmpR family regulator